MKKRRANGWLYHPYIFNIFRSLYESSFPEDLIGANSEYEWLFVEKGKEFFYFCSSVTPVFIRFKSKINVVLKTISSNSCTHLERCTYSIGKPGNTLNIFCSKGLKKVVWLEGASERGQEEKKNITSQLKKFYLDYLSLYYSSLTLMPLLITFLVLKL